MRKSLILTRSFEKFSSYGGGPSGKLLKRRAVSDGPLRGGLTAPKIHVILENTLSFSTILPHFNIYSPLNIFEGF